MNESNDEMTVYSESEIDDARDKISTSDWRKIYKAILPQDMKPSLRKMRIDRNSRCPCGSGIKYKKCCFLI